MAELRRLGARSVPLVVVGDRYAKGQSVNNIIELLDLGDRQEVALSPTVLVARASTILAGAERFIVQFEPAQLAVNVRDRQRTLWVLGHHIFRIVEAFIEATTGELDEITKDSLTGDPDRPPGEGEEIAVYGRQVQARLQRWWAQCEDRHCKAIIKTYYGDQTVHEMLERSTWHAGQHVRQLMLLLEDYGVAVNDPVPASTFDDLPMPQQAWDG